MRPLARIRVLGFAAADPGRLATTLLADLGADVVVVVPPDPGEHPGTVQGAGSPSRRARRPRSVALDLASPAGQDLAARLAAVADALVEDLPSAATEGFGLGRARLAARTPGLHVLPSFVPALWQGVSDTAGLRALVELQASAGCRRPAAARSRGDGARRPALPGQQTDEVIEDWLHCRAEDIEHLRFEGAFG